jgi:hypothetical protein
MTDEERQPRLRAHEVVIDIDLGRRNRTVGPPRTIQRGAGQQT